MAGIERIGGPVVGNAARARRGAAGFALPEELAANAAGPPGSVAPAALGLLGLQEQGDGPRRDTAARQQAEELLDALRELQAGQLGGAADPTRLRRLATQEQAPAADPDLREAVAAVVLRARIELARRSVPPTAIA